MIKHEICNQNFTNNLKLLLDEMGLENYYSAKTKIQSL